MSEMGKTMKVRREVHGLDYVVCSMVTLLDHIFRKRIKTWCVSKGLDLEITDRRKDTHGDVLVIVHPVGWAEDEHIYLRCQHGTCDIAWEVFEGTVCSRHILQLFNSVQFSFRVNNWVESIAEISPVYENSPEAKFLANIKS